MIPNLLRISSDEALHRNGEIIYIHNANRSLSGAFELSEKCDILLKIPRTLGATQVKLNFYNENNTLYIKSIKAIWSELESVYDVYSVELSLDSLGVGLYFYNIEITSVVGKVFGFYDKNSIAFGDSSHSAPSFQLSVSDFEHKAPRDLLGGMIYHVFVDRFCRGKVKKGGYKASDLYVENWDESIPEYPEYPGAPIKNNYFYGGDLWGLADKLDYIRSLGVNIIYLSPIFESPSNHKYDTSDYMKVDEAFGGDEALRSLISKASEYGISIILDGVFNHTGADSIYFNKFNSYDTVGAYQSTDSEYYEWFDFQNYPQKYTSWWGIEILPRINPDIPSCRNYLSGKGGVIEKYAKLGIRGFRLDVVDELSDDFIRSVKNRLNEVDSSSVLYGEVWEDASNKIAYGKRKKYFLGNELDGVMNYPLRMGLISFLRYGNTDKLQYALTDIIFNAPKRIRDMQMNLIGSHDTERIITALGGESPVGKTNEYLSCKLMNSDEYNFAKSLVMSAYTVLLTLPGIPSVYYGDEAGMEGYGDPFNRRTFPWGNEDYDILNHFKKISNIRQSYEVYKEGEFKLIHLDTSVLIFSRFDSFHSYITIVNNSDKDMDFVFKSESVSLYTMKKSYTFKVKTKSSTIIKSDIINQLEF